MGNLKKQQDISSILRQALSIVSKHQWFQNGVTVWKCSIRVKIGNQFLSRVTLKFDGWLWRTIGHFFYATSSFMHHFIAISQFKLELQPGNAQFSSKSEICGPVWPWNLTDGALWKSIRPIFYATCASFHNHRWIQTRVTVRKRLTGIKVASHLSPVTLKFDGWSRKKIGHLLYVTSRFVHNFEAISKVTVWKRPNCCKICFDLCDLDLWPLTLACCMKISFVSGNYSRKFHDDAMRET